MEWWQELLSNRVLWVVVTAWLLAQVIKTIVNGIIAQSWDFKRLWGLGGMPSSHSATVCALAVGVGMVNGFNTVEFVIATVLACVVMTDAAGVRRAAGQQATLLNRMVEDMVADGHTLSEETLKELLGHSPFEVLMGALLGVIWALVMLGFVCP